jgi:catechol 2,3-dioxygenase-like lactoylglutathione lyase family enzyme
VEGFPHYPHAENHPHHDPCARSRAIDAVLFARLRFRRDAPTRLSRLHADLSENPEDDFEIELTHNHDRTTPYTHGDGYGHYAFSTDDLDAMHGELTELGYTPTPIKEFRKDDALIARFFFVQDPDGYKIEVLQRGGHYV